MRNRNGSSTSRASHCSSFNRACASPRSRKRGDDPSSSASTPNFCAKRFSSPREALRSARSTKCVLIRRSEKNLKAFRVSALFLIPKTCTSNAFSTNCLASRSVLGRCTPRRPIYQHAGLLYASLLCASLVAPRSASPDHLGPDVSSNSSAPSHDDALANGRRRPSISRPACPDVPDRPAHPVPPWARGHFEVALCPRLL